MKRKGAFTFIELLTVIAVLSVLGCLLLPAMARTRRRSYSAGCLNGLRQMMVGWAMYKDENNDYLLPNAPIGYPPNEVWVLGSENWGNANANKNTGYYLTGLLAPYINNHIESYRCPADVIPSSNGTRLRSRAMNSQVGLIYFNQNYNPGWRTYIRVNDLTCPTPKDLFIFADESMYSLDDGYFQPGLLSPGYSELPASYHDGGGGFSFADGHAEIRKWQWSAPNAGILAAPYAYGVVNNGAFWPSSAQDVDWQWLTQHSSCKVQ